MAGDWHNSFASADSFRDRLRDARRDGDGQPCARGYFCAEAARSAGDDGKAVRTPPLGPAAFCVTDEAIIARCIRKVPEVHAVLIRFLGVKVTAEQIVRVPFGPSVPLRLDVDEIARLLVDAVMSWHQRVTEVTPLAGLDTQEWRAASLGADPGSLLPRSCGVLSAHLSALLGLEPAWQVRPSSSPAAKLAYGAIAELEHAGQVLAMAGGAQAGNEFLRLDYLARAAIGITAPPVTVLLGVACANERCDGVRSLRLADPPQHEGDTAYYSQCMRCRHLMTEQEFRMWADQNARWWKRRLTPAQLAARGGIGEGQAARLLDAVAGPGAA